MNILNQLSKITTKGSRRVGRGYGCKKGGHTSGRGAKGDNVRGHGKLTFDGTKIKKGWLKRTPFLRGKHRLESQKDIVIFTLDQISKYFKANEIVSRESLSKKTKEIYKSVVKILSTGTIDKVLTFKGLEYSTAAKAKIEKAGGKIE